jgi:Predicted nucleotide-binding protein containing TIR-like domain
VPSGSADAGLVDSLVAALLDVDFLEVHGVLRSTGADRLPPGWRDFSPVAKRRTLKPIIEGLSREKLVDLARDFVPLDGNETPMNTEAGAGSVQSAWRPPYTAPEDPAERYGLGNSVGPTTSASSPLGSPSTAREGEPASIFVVHGRDTAIETQTALLVERTTRRSAVVLHEQITGGRTVVEQIEQHGAEASYAIVLLTGDDEGGLRGGEMKPRARQNVVLELGYFWGALGRDRVAVLVQEGVELPSDAGGIHYISIDSGGGWKANWPGSSNTPASTLTGASCGSENGRVA